MQKQWLMLLAVCLQASDIRISEVMSNPQGSEYENEFIEVYNAGELPLEITGWILSDGVGIDTLASWSGPKHISPGQFGLILDPGYVFEQGPYTDIIPDSIPIYTISTDASFGSGGLANAAEQVIIRHPDSLTGSSMSWSSASENGYSWERLQMAGDDATAQWAQSLLLNGTPGFRNSVSPPELNLSLAGLQVKFAEMNRPILLMARVLNSGNTVIESFQIHVYQDQDQNGFQNASEWVKTYSFFDLVTPENFVDLPLTLPLLNPGVHVFEARLLLDGDQNPLDDTSRIQLSGAYPPDALCINEIMFSPDPEQGGEWIEIWNHSGAPLSLQGWTLADANEARHPLSNNLLWIPTDSLFLLCRDVAVAEYFSLDVNRVLPIPGWPTLNSGSDSIRLFDASGCLNTSAFYRGNWGEAGRSLERRHPTLQPYEQENWQASLHPDGATPLTPNSQRLSPLQLRIEGLRRILNGLVGPAAVDVSVRFSNQGFETLTQLTLVAGSISTWTGQLESFSVDSLTVRFPATPAGISQHDLQIFQDTSLLCDTLFSITLGFPADQLALNEILYLPAEDQVEFLEFVNVGNEAINLQGWVLQDRSGSRGVVQERVIIPTHSYFVLAGDSARMSDWCSPSVPIVELLPWPSLNNTGDSLVLFDPVQTPQLTHSYQAAQGGGTGVSLERLALWRTADRWDNWTGCLDPLGNTAGRENSLLLPENNLCLTELALKDSLLTTGGPLGLTLTLLNDGDSTVASARIQLYLYQESQLISEYEEWIYEILPDESISVELNATVPECGWVDILALLTAFGDGNPDDDQVNLKTYIGCDLSPLVISEILPIPETDNSEWIELYNRSDRSVDLQGWQITDNGSAGAVLSDSSFLLAASSYLVLSSDGTIQASGGTSLVVDLPSLNNSADGLQLQDPQSRPMDLMSYDLASGLVPGRSLERIRLDGTGNSSNNWGICIAGEGSTPGYENSLNLTVLAETLTLDLAPNPFSPDGDGIEDALLINYELPFEQGFATLWMFDMAGRRIAEPVPLQAVGHRGQFSWDGQASYGGTAVTGLYILKLMVDDLNGKVWTELRKVYLLR